MMHSATVAVVCKPGYVSLCLLFMFPLRPHWHRWLSWSCEAPRGVRGSADVHTVNSNLLSDILTFPLDPRAGTPRSQGVRDTMTESRRTLRSCTAWQHIGIGGALKRAHNARPVFFFHPVLSKLKHCFARPPLPQQGLHRPRRATEVCGGAR